MTIRDYLPEEKAPRREDIDQMKGPVLVEFGTAWCGYCQAAQQDIVTLLATHPEVRHLKVEDGPGRRLGRTFRVKLWPNLVFMKDGAVVRQLARPSATEMREAAQAITAAAVKTERLGLSRPPRSRNPALLGLCAVPGTKKAYLGADLGRVPPAIGEAKLPRLAGP